MQVRGGKFVCPIQSVAVSVAGSGDRFPGPNLADTRSERSTKLFEKRLIYFNLEAVTFEDRHEFGDPAIGSEFMILDRSALDPRPTGAADVSQNLKFAALAIELEIVHDLDPMVVHDALERHQRRDDALCGLRGGLSIGQSSVVLQAKARRRDWSDGSLHGPEKLAL